MSGFIQGQSRNQSTMFPERLDDYVSEDNPVRVVDVFIDGLNLENLGFKTVPEKTGRPSYHPAMMLKLYVYGYLNRIQSSRRLEREAGRNLELIWLTGRLAPDFKTIADFRKDNTESIKKVCREFVLVCRKLELFGDALVAIDGSKFKADNNRDRNYTAGKIKHRLKLIDESIARYLQEIASADRQDDSALAAKKTERLEARIAKLNEEVERLNALAEAISELPDQQLSQTDPDARSLRTRGTGIVGYNVQVAVEAENHLIVAHEVTNEFSDRSLLSSMAAQAKDALATDELNVVADKGYYRSEELRACEEAGVTAYVPKPQTSNNQAKGLFGKRDFIYRAESDEYECPAGQRLIYRFTCNEDGKINRRYWSSACSTCAIKEQCTTGKQRRVTRWIYEDVLERAEARLEHDPSWMKVRRETVEHTFGTLKCWMGATHFQMRTLDKVATEMSLHVLSYNLKRAINILGVPRLLAAMA